nr:translation initiation factor IF-2-like [Anser cygnoides]
MAPRRVCSCAALSEHVPGGRTCALGPRPSGTPGRRPPGRAAGERPSPVPEQRPRSGLEPAAPGAAPRPARSPLRERSRAQARARAMRRGRVGAAEGAPAPACRGGFLRLAALFLGVPAKNAALGTGVALGDREATPEETSLQRSDSALSQLSTHVSNKPNSRV